MGEGLLVGEGERGRPRSRQRAGGGAWVQAVPFPGKAPAGSCGQGVGRWLPEPTACCPLPGDPLVLEWEWERAWKSPLGTKSHPQDVCYLLRIIEVCSGGWRSDISWKGSEAS